MLAKEFRLATMPWQPGLRARLDSDGAKSLVEIEPRVVPFVQAKVADEVALEHRGKANGNG
jgi:hypothetical protein